MELQNHSFAVEHRKGSLNNVPDALSRTFEEEEPAIAALELERETNDQWYLKIVKDVQQYPRDFPTFKSGGGGGGRLYKYKPNKVIDESLGDDDAWKLAVPHEKRCEVL